MRSTIISLFTLTLSSITFAQTPPHFAHIPANAGINNTYFNEFACKKFQFIYTQAEIASMISPVSGALNIDTLWFRHGGGAAPFTQLSNFQIRMGHTTLTAPGPIFGNNFNLGSVQTVVSSPTYTYTPLLGAAGNPTNNWTFIPLETSFNYNFIDNLCVEFSFSASSNVIAGNFADNGGVPISQVATSNSATTATSTAARPMFGISGSGSGSGGPVTCNPNGNWLLFTNYDGGNLEIIVDEDIPNLYIAVCSYEDCAVTLSGPFAQNVVQLRYAGYQGNNLHCNNQITTTTLSAPPGVVTDVTFAPASVLPDPDGNGSIICAYSCGDGNQGGCNTIEQVVAYFQAQFGGNLRGLEVQYCCWSEETPYRVSHVSGNCCNSASTGVATVTYPSGPFCVGDADVSPTITGDNSGTFYSVPEGLSINAATGTVNLTTSVPGAYQMVYANPVHCNDILINNTF
ncbi:MAG: hypothetical protein ACK5B6_03550, partial [Bacteroidia bacterium]